MLEGVVEGRKAYLAFAFLQGRIFRCLLDSSTRFVVGAIIHETGSWTDLTTASETDYFVPINITQTKAPHVTVTGVLCIA